MHNYFIIMPKNSKDEIEDTDHYEGKINKENSRINIKLPQFWSDSATTWFILAEAQFGINEISNDAIKYNYVISSLPQDVAEAITDLLENPPKDNKYKHLKKTLIERNSFSIEVRLKKLLSNELMGDKKPSDFYRYLKKLTGSSNTVGEELIKKIWLSRLPNIINIALIPQKEEHIDKVLSVADQVWEAMQSSNVSAIQTQSDQYNSMPSTSKTSFSNNASSNNTFSNKVASSNDDKYNNLKSEIDSLKTMMKNLNSNFNRSRDRSRSGSFSKQFRTRSNSHKRFNSKGRLCWYHSKYGDLARKCISPCQFKSKSSNNPKN